MNLNDTKAIFNVPVHYSKNIFYQTFFEMPILDGYPSRANLNSLKIINRLDAYLTEGKINETRKLLHSIGVKYVIINWKGNINIPEVSHLSILINPEKFYNVSKDILEPLYSSPEVSFFRVL